MYLDILIPTYNRSDYLLSNLLEITNSILEINSDKEVRIIVSDNASSDDTEFKISQFIKDNKNIEICYFRNEENIGLKRNILKVLSYSKSKYIMFVGDDDYISREYWAFIMSDYCENNNIGLVLPSRQIVKPSLGLHNTYLTNDDVKIKLFENTNFNLIRMTSYCNQLTGILFLNNSLYEKSKYSCLDNLYPFMTFAGWSLEKSNGLMVTNNPILVTEGVIKYWGYGNDGLIIEILDNVKYISSKCLRYINELFYLIIWRGRIEMNLVIGGGIVMRGIKEVFKSRKILFTSKLFYLIILGILIPKYWIYKISGRLSSPHMQKK